MLILEETVKKNTKNPALTKLIFDDIFWWWSCRLTTGDVFHSNNIYHMAASAPLLFLW